MRPDLVDYTVEIVGDLGVRESERAKAGSREDRVTDLVGLERPVLVGLAVELDDKPRRRRDEVENVRSEGRLASKSASKLAVTKLLPEEPLGAGRLGPHPACAVDEQPAAGLRVPGRNLGRHPGKLPFGVRARQVKGVRRIDPTCIACRPQGISQLWNPPPASGTLPRQGAGEGGYCPIFPFASMRSSDPEPVGDGDGDGNGNGNGNGDQSLRPTTTAFNSISLEPASVQEVSR